MSSTMSGTGRTRQKKRTRQALLTAARDLMRAGGEPTVPEVAAAAEVSKATAYRYFSSREALLLEAALDAEVKPAAAILPPGETDASTRAAAVQAYFFELAAAHEPRFRLYLAATLQEWVRTKGASAVHGRGRRRIPMLEAALAPAAGRLDRHRRTRLVQALAAMAGIEAYVALADVCRLPPAEARAVMGWAVRLLVKGALAEAEEGEQLTPAPAAAARRAAR